MASNQAIDKNAYVHKVCKVGQGAACCRYLGVHKNGVGCLKLTETKAYLDARVANESMCARGDNCDGHRFSMDLCNEPAPGVLS